MKRGYAKVGTIERTACKNGEPINLCASFKLGNQQPKQSVAPAAQIRLRLAKRLYRLAEITLQKKI